MNKVLKNITDGLMQTGNQETWGFANWPYRLTLFQKKQTHYLTAEMINEKDEVLDTLPFNLTTRMEVLRSKIYADTTQNLLVSFGAVQIANLVGEHVRIISIDGIKTEQAQEEGYIRVTPAENIPPRIARNPLIKLTSDFLNIR
jgi:hypothetical protein